MSYIDVIRMKTHLKNFKNTFLTIFHISGRFWPIPAMNRINKNRKKSYNMSKNTIFQKSIFCYVVAGNMIFCRKLALWTSESTQKHHIDFPTWYDSIWGKVKKIEFFIPKIMVKNFPKSIFSADEPLSPNRYGGSIDPIGAPKVL